MNTAVVVGTYKVAYWEGGNVLRAVMFDSLDQARLFEMKLPKGAVSSIMKNESAAGGRYSWTVMSEGAGRWVPAVSWLYKNRRNVGIGLGVLVAYKVIIR